MWAPSARADLSESLSYVARDSTHAARQILGEALEKAASLESMGERGRIVPEFEAPSIRELFVHRYRLIYRVGEAEIRIVAFLHGTRDFSKRRREREGG